MGGGIVLTFLVVAALTIPVVWVIWWALASLGDPHPRSVPALATGRAAPAPAPHAVDTGFPIRPGEIVIRRFLDGMEVGSCHGPDSAGRCPRVAAGVKVPCAGSVLALPQPVRGSLEWHIPAGYRTCMLGSYDTFRQPKIAGQVQ